MAFSGGVFTRIYNWVTDKANGINITASRMDAEMDGMATGLSTCVLKDGTQTITANLPMSGFKFTGVGDATATNQFLTAGQAIASTLVWGGTSGGTANAQTISPTIPLTGYTAGHAFEFIAGNTNTAATTLAVSGLTAKDIKKTIGGALVALVPGDIVANTVVRVTYDGTQFNLLNPQTRSHGADIASATTVNLDTATGDLVDVTGSTAITAITLSEGRECTVRFTGILPLTHGSSLVLPGAANITTAAGDYAVFRGYASGVVRCSSYTRSTGQSIIGPALDDLTDVTITSIAANEVLARNAGNTGYVNQVRGVIWQEVVVSTAVDSTTNTVPRDTSIPQTSEMDAASALVIAYTPKRNDTRILVELKMFIGTSGADGTGIAAIVKDSGTQANAVGCCDTRSALDIDEVECYLDEASTGSAVTYRAYYGGTTGTIFLNQDSGNNTYGGITSMMKITEYLP